MHKTITGVLAATLLASTATQAALVDRGGGMIYDSDLDITWLSDANYAQTSGHDADGRMNWAAGMAWADGLVFGGFDDWRLPTTLQPDASCDNQFDPGGGLPLQGAAFNCTGSEMGHLFYNELGGNAVESVFDTTGDTTQEIANLALFTNVQFTYWSGTAFAPLPGHAWSFTLDGYQVGNDQRNEFYAWAVRPGDVAAVPEPSSLMLVALALALAGVGAARRSGRFGGYGPFGGVGALAPAGLTLRRA